MDIYKLVAERDAVRTMHHELFHSEFNTRSLDTSSDEYLCALLERNDRNGDFDELSRDELVAIMKFERSDI